MMGGIEGVGGTAEVGALDGDGGTYEQRSKGEEPEPRVVLKFFSARKKNRRKGCIKVPSKSDGTCKGFVASRLVRRTKRRSAWLSQRECRRCDRSTEPADENDHSLRKESLLESRSSRQTTAPHLGPVLAKHRWGGCPSLDK